MDGTLQYQIQLENAQALAAMERFNAATEKMAAKIDGIRTTSASADGATTSLFSKIANFGSNIANTVAGVESLGKAISWLKGAQTAAAASAQAVSVANTALSATSNAVGAGARAGAVGLGLFGGAAAGAAVSFAALMSALGAILPVIAAVSLAVSSLGAIAKGIGLANEFERTSIAFKTLTGDAKQAQAVMSMLSQMAIDTPFDEATLQGGARALLAARVPASMLKQELKAIGNIASATNGDVGSLATVYAQVAGKGKLYAEELQQFVEQGAGALREQVAKTMGVTTAAAMEMMQKGQVGFSVLQQAIQDLAGETGKWGGAMSDQSTSNLGLLSSLADNIGKILRLIATPIADGPLKSFLSSAVAVSSQVATVLGGAISQGNLGESLYMALALGAKKGFNAFMDFLAKLQIQVGIWSAQVAGMIAAAMKGKVSAALEAARQLSSFNMDTMRFDTGAEEKFFDNLIAKAGQVNTKLGEVVPNFAQAMDSIGTPASDDPNAPLPKLGEAPVKDPMALPGLPGNQIQARMALAAPPEKPAGTDAQAASPEAGASPEGEAPAASDGIPTSGDAYMSALLGTPEAPAAIPAAGAAPTIPAAPQGGGYRDNSMTNAAEVAGAADKKIRGYSREKQGGADAARGRAEARMSAARARVAAAYNPAPAADAVQAALTPPGGAGVGAGGAAAASGGPGAGMAPVISKLEAVISELQRIRTE